MVNTMSDHPIEVQTGPKKQGEPYKECVERAPCPKCGVVQEFDVMVQQYEDARPLHYPDHECPVCGHKFEDPW